MDNTGGGQKAIPIQFPPPRRFSNFLLIPEILVIKGQNPTLPKMADFNPEMGCISKTSLKFGNRLDGGNCIGISYWPPHLLSVW